jgi:hypothetical protein
MNLRFYYDASLLEFQKADEFHTGYGLLGEAPKAFAGNEVSGVQLFNFSRAAAYVNGAVQLLNDQTPLELFPVKWVKAFRLCFKVPQTVSDQEHFCPAVIWDLKTGVGAGGFLPGGDGMLITVTENNRSTVQESAPAISSGTSLNWQYSSEAGLPYGKSVSSDCISISELVSTEFPDQVDANGYALFQNQPNPFDGKTVIEFVIPYAQHATLTFYDLDGSKMEEIQGDYQAGKNQVVITQKPWMVQSNIFYYSLKTEKYTSKPRKMTLVRA